MNTSIKNTTGSNDAFMKYAPKAVALLCLLTVVSFTSFLTRGWALMDFNIAVVAALSALVLLLNIQLARGVAINPKKKLLIRIMHRCSYVPYLFGIYLFLFKGFWSLTIMVKSFSIMLAVMSLFYLICGHFVVNAGFQSCPMARLKVQNR
ncbi:hypothetical protein GZ77_25160 [Endozoicomonas montiporae]|uniref:Uncharacterized protein n=2 Tax=Endozoicomonas montiporae TaxID=1027273 RepID=A0A081MYY0_9GAMM|nr:hypothetical protein [Endozoicomonas montiporae]AMO54869.1 hypothetical protein EZMO1_0629 [Endozoicomonas montiporae CL-33]KEQ11403.1 hypothetical protein GZ77_25160 [Endozoicomonas montiporae]